MTDHDKLILVTPKELQSALDYFNELREKFPDELNWDSDEKCLDKDDRNTMKMIIYNNKECVPWDDTMKVLSAIADWVSDVLTSDEIFYDNVQHIIKRYGGNIDQYDFSECETRKQVVKKRKLSELQ